MFARSDMGGVTLLTCPGFSWIPGFTRAEDFEACVQCGSSSICLRLCFYFPLLVLKRIDHYWKCLISSQGAQANDSSCSSLANSARLMQPRSHAELNARGSENIFVLTGCDGRRV